jgi:hypothetical protein
MSVKVMGHLHNTIAIAEVASGLLELGSHTKSLPLLQMLFENLCRFKGAVGWACRRCRFSLGAISITKSD